jgi:hypothetical protein
VAATNVNAARFPWGEEHNTESIAHEASDSRPDSTTVRGEYATTVKLADRTLRWESQVTIRSDRTHFYLSIRRRLFRDGALVRERSWERAIPRDHQ